MKAVHYVEHHCQASDDCECSAACRIQGCEIQETGARSHATCKNCIRILNAGDRRRLEKLAGKVYRGSPWGYPE